MAGHLEGVQAGRAQVARGGEPGVGYWALGLLTYCPTCILHIEYLVSCGKPVSVV